MVCVPNFLKFWKMKCWKFENWNLENLKYGILDFNKNICGYLNVYQMSWRWAPQNNGNWLNNISKILDMSFISIKNNTWECGKSYKVFIFKSGNLQHPTTYRLPSLHQTGLTNIPVQCTSPMYPDWPIDCTPTACTQSFWCDCLINRLELIM